MTSDGHGASDAVNRREFLGLAPRHLLGGIRAALNQTMALALMSVAEHPSTAQQIAVIDLANCRARLLLKLDRGEAVKPSDCEL